MFQWDKSISNLDLTVEKVVNLFRSMRDVQLALPGLPAQEASAYLCQYQTPQGVGTSVVFHLHKSGQLAFYVNTPSEVAAGKAEAMLDQATVFVESMGFLMTDLDIHLLSESDREMLWSSLPLQKGIESAGNKQVGKSSPASLEPASRSGQSSGGQQLKIGHVAALQELSAGSEFLREEEPAQKPAAAEVPPAQPLPGVSDDGDKGGQGNVDDLLAAVEALRTRRPGVRARKKPPSQEELKRRRQELRESIGHILASQ